MTIHQHLGGLLVAEIIGFMVMKKMKIGTALPSVLKVVLEFLISLLNSIYMPI